MGINVKNKKSVSICVICVPFLPHTELTELTESMELSKILCFQWFLCALYLDKQNLSIKDWDRPIFNIFLRSFHCHLANKIRI